MCHQLMHAPFNFMYICVQKNTVWNTQEFSRNFLLKWPALKWNRSNYNFVSTALIFLLWNTKCCENMKIYELGYHVATWQKNRLSKVVGSLIQQMKNPHFAFCMSTQFEFKGNLPWLLCTLVLPCIALRLFINLLCLLMPSVSSELVIQGFCTLRKASPTLFCTETEVSLRQIQPLF